MKRSMLGLGTDEEPGEEPSVSNAAGHSLLGLEDLASERRRPSAPSDRPLVPHGPSAPIEDEDIFHLQRTSDQRAFPIERAILFSIAAHILFLVLLLHWPRWGVSPDPRRGLLGAFLPPEKTAEDKIPIVFRSAPGPARESSQSSVASDANRRAGGGDRSRPRSETPFVPPRQGIEGLAEGRRAAAGAPRIPAPAIQPGQRSASGAAPERSGAAAPEKSAASPDAFRVPPAGMASPGREGSPAGEGSALQGLDRAIREAAKGVEKEGENGAGFPNPDGGFVDSGPISFDTAWYNWGPYAAEMVRRIKLHWDIPELARLGWKGKLTIRFFIRGNGAVEAAAILSRSGIPPFDFAALQAIVKSNPFRPLPKDLGSDREGVTVTFFYNIRPGREGESGAPR